MEEAQCHLILGLEMVQGPMCSMKWLGDIKRSYLIPEVMNDQNTSPTPTPTFYFVCKLSVQYCG